MGTYANIGPVNVKFDETRYQTIGKAHGFSELDGVQFKISEKYSYTPTTLNEIFDKLKSTHLETNNLNNTYHADASELCSLTKTQKAQNLPHLSLTSVEKKPSKCFHLNKGLTYSFDLEDKVLKNMGLKDS